MMASKNLQKLIILSSSIFVTCLLTGSPAFGQEVELTNIQTSPSQVYVGNSFHINATIVNNSPDTIYFNGGCQSPLTATFDKNVVINQAMGCFAIFNAEIKPGQNATIVGPDSSHSYTAISSGTTNTNVIFSYKTENKSENTISKLFTFDIAERTSIPEFPSIFIVMLAAVVISSILVMVSKVHYRLN